MALALIVHISDPVRLGSLTVGGPACERTGLGMVPVGGDWSVTRAGGLAPLGKNDYSGPVPVPPRKVLLSGWVTVVEW